MIDAETAFQAVIDRASQVAAARAPTTLADLGSLAVAVALMNECCLDEEADDVHAGLAALIRGILAVTGVDLPAGFEGLSDRG
ncbi:hypothetical protein [Methylobacterium sp. ARG-1]|uniref:hypothetical protein n=1 Tax=Methylobacterium sp. ARG-1 TaxID=1692501 RepID=UPI001364A828|nr:hypothetical protein [Methylobacterium sp. ARG-1]